jgi:small subunit ribosomal protein S21
VIARRARINLSNFILGIKRIVVSLQPEIKNIQFFHQKRSIYMLIVPVKDGEPIDKALKKYKRKFERAGILKELRRRKAFAKPSVERRTEVLKAIYKEEMYGNKND